ncbi:PAS domain-containing protein [Roseomonas xinghualingensis]|uniref:PAS domain-containing protein n=1 Tax=Roseomonas xinghualingensis TaxID=2986475 RepID=UPI0021F0D778|nr:PAS domain-containing protein [Roseomonas sp. SXEYE001]MCV4208550.1 PAS domain-containing protein [Roseomonas sp. SXEYE001]
MASEIGTNGTGSNGTGVNTPTGWPVGGGAMGERIRARDWASTPLGPSSEWPSCLRTAIELCLASAFPSFVFWGPDLLQFHNDAALRLIGPQGLEKKLGLPMRETWPVSWGLVRPLTERILQGETIYLEDFSFPVASPRPAGEALFTCSGSPLRDGEGLVVGLFATMVETTRHAQTERGLQENQRQLSSLVEGIPQLIWRATSGGRWNWASPQWSAHTGQSAEEGLDHGWLRALHPDDREIALEAWRRADAGERYDAEYRILHAGEQRYRWFQTRATPIRDEEGRITEWLGTSTDVDELRRMEEHQRLLLAELQHRGRNMLSVIRSIIRRTVRASDTVEDLAMHLDGRINAFARVQAAVTRDPGAGIDLAQMVADELLAHAAREEKRLWMEGPPVHLRPKAAEALGLAIHELTTNAVKYGALSVPQGRIDVTWRTEPSRLVINWRESGVPGPVIPLREGFGTDLLERTLPYELNAKVRQSFEESGLHCTIELPLTGRILAAPAPPSPIPA